MQGTKAAFGRAGHFVSGMLRAHPFPLIGSERNVQRAWRSQQYSVHDGTEGCTTFVQARGVCLKHGAFGTCQVDGCTTAAESVAKGTCWKHGGGRKRVCKMDGRGVCTKHGARMNVPVMAAPPANAQLVATGSILHEAWRRKAIDTSALSTQHEHRCYMPGTSSECRAP
eukprot:gene285-biopygen6995